MHYVQTISSPLGTLTLTASEHALTGLYFGRVAAAGVSKTNAVLEAAKQQLAEYFAGMRQEFSLKLAPEGTEFQQAAWKALEQIPYGQTLSYSAQAASVGKENGQRAVGSANGKNPICIIIPCHRVIAASGGLGGYSGGIEHKKWLLAHEAKWAKKRQAA